MKLFVTGGAIALAMTYLVLMGLQGTTVYFLTVSELLTRGAAKCPSRLETTAPDERDYAANG